MVLLPIMFMCVCGCVWICAVRVRAQVNLVGTTVGTSSEVPCAFHIYDAKGSSLLYLQVRDHG